MGLKKCPKCELNYIRDDEQYCDVCRRSMKGRDSDPDEGVSICVECGENPAVRGSELCAICLREVRRQEKVNSLAGEEDARGMDLPQVELSDIEVPIPVDDIPESELEEIDKELGDDREDEIEDGAGDDAYGAEAGA